MSELNDPRVFFAAERTLLAWNRTSLTLMAFGFVIERFGLFLRLLTASQSTELERGTSYWIGLAFILLGSFVALSSVLQFRKVLLTLRPKEIPEGYAIQMGVIANGIVALLGAALVIYLFHSAA